jgi:hypothetical protein
MLWVVRLCVHSEVLVLLVVLSIMCLVNISRWLSGDSVGEEWRLR